MNKHLIAGNVGNDPEIKSLESGMTIANFSIAVNEFRKDKTTGEKIKETTWLKIVAFGRLAELVKNYVKKGEKLLVCGRVKVRNYETESGEKRVFVETIADEIQFLSSRNQNEGNQNDQIEDPDDDLPF